MVFAVVGTAISAGVVGSGLYFLGQLSAVPLLGVNLSVSEAAAFGSLISAVDPVATLNIFRALDADPTLYMSTH